MNKTTCFFVSDLHGHLVRYQKLFDLIVRERPLAVFLGGDLLPSGLLNIFSGSQVYHDFIERVLHQGFARLQHELGGDYPQVYIILGNDDGKFAEQQIIALAEQGVWHYAHNRHFSLGEFSVFGYAYVPPTPFTLKDWERYDVSRYVDPGCTSPEEGYYSVLASDDDKRWSTIQSDLHQLTVSKYLENAIFLFHAPPYNTNLDRAALDGSMFDSAPLDVHVGSIAIRRFIQQRQPHLTLHGHIHESARLTGAWRDQIGKTWCFSAAHDGPELAMIAFDLARPDQAVRRLF